MRDKPKFRGPRPPARQRRHPLRQGRPDDAEPTEAIQDEAATEGGPIRIWGIHAVAAALANPARRIQRVELTDNAENRLAEALKQRRIPQQRVHPRDLDRKLGEDTVHQGVMLEVEALEALSLEAIAARVTKGHPLIVLDQVTDPHNVGAILRSAAVFEAAGLVMTRRNAPPLSGALAKAASGALEHVPVTLVPNLARALEELADLGLRRVGLDGEAERLLEDEDLGDRLALVMGSEGRGLRRLTRESCEALVRIGTSGAITSLNVSTAAAIALHATAARHRKPTA
jgi:23S rRNA (guanosine2251-2'-O)-methyltransferase